MTSPDKPPSLEDIDRAPLRLPRKKRERNPQYNDEVWWDKWHTVSNENFELLEENARLKREKQTTDILNDLAKPYARNAFRFMCGYAGIVSIILLLDGFKLYGFDLEVEVMQILVGSTAATVIGLVATVLTGIFISRPK